MKVIQEPRARAGVFSLSGTDNGIRPERQSKGMPLPPALPSPTSTSRMRRAISDDQSMFRSLQTWKAVTLLSLVALWLVGSWGLLITVRGGQWHAQALVAGGGVSFNCGHRTRPMLGTDSFIEWGSELLSPRIPPLGFDRWSVPWVKCRYIEKHGASCFGPAGGPGPKVTINMPVWTAMLLTAGVPWTLAVRRVRSRRGALECERCGYSRVGLEPQAVCPECGRTSAATPSATTVR